MKKISLFLLSLSIVVMLGGCKEKEPETEAPTEAPTESEIVTEAPTEAPTETEREDSMNKTRELKGLVLSSDTDKLTIQTERGKELEFSITGADIQLQGGIQKGANVNILYKGEINGTDTSSARVLMIVDLEAGETPVTEGELMTEAEFSDPDAGAGSLGGTIQDVNVDRIVILADDGESYYFSTYDADINLVNGLQEGNYVTVEYDGDIYGPDLVPATAITDNDPSAGDETAKAGPSVGGNYSYISGTVTDCGTNTITIYTDDGMELTFDTSEATQRYIYGIVAGNYISLEYSGTLNDGDTTGVRVNAVYDYSEDDASDDGYSDDGSDEDYGAEGADEDGVDEADAGVENDGNEEDA